MESQLFVHSWFPWLAQSEYGVEVVKCPIQVGYIYMTLHLIETLNLIGEYFIKCVQTLLPGYEKRNICYL